MTAAVKGRGCMSSAVAQIADCGETAAAACSPRPRAVLNLFTYLFTCGNSSTGKGTHTALFQFLLAFYGKPPII